jgi:hypothetical protein
LKQKKILHILEPDNFAELFIPFVNKEFNSEEHIFLCTTKPEDSLLYANKNIRYLHSPYRKHIFKNIKIFRRYIKEASKIILHGNPVLFYFFLFPQAIKKIYWVILGYELKYTSLLGNAEKTSRINSFIKNFVLKRISFHISNVVGDSALANAQFGSNAKCFYSPMYLSNVVTAYKQQEKSGTALNVKKILAGNSTSPRNNHIAIFKMLLPYKDENIIIYCPLSYGNFPEYKEEIIRAGTEMFGNKFHPMTTLLPLEEYNKFIDSIDIAVFNHKRQEAMGVMVNLLSRGKILYMNNQPTSYQSFIQRGFKVFDNLLIEKEGLFADKDVTANHILVLQEYSYERLIETLRVIFNN